jgi:hypothetical protein
MKNKYIVFIILLLNISAYLCSQEKYETNKSIEYNFYREIERDFNASFRFVFPPPDPSTFAFVDFSAGISYGITSVYYIGIAGDIAIGSDWFALFSTDENENRNTDKKYTQFGFSLGARIYNFIRISNNFRIIPFFGCDFFYIVLPIPYIGAEILIKMIGIEYAYYLPISNNISRHQISLKIHLSIE